MIDLVADVDAKTTVVDFKSAGSTLDGHGVALSDQLTAYKLAEPEAEQVALWVLIKTKEPKIEWYPSRRSRWKRFRLSLLALSAGIGWP